MTLAKPSAVKVTEPAPVRRLETSGGRWSYGSGLCLRNNEDSEEED